MDLRMIKFIKEFLQKTPRHFVREKYARHSSSFMFNLYQRYGDGVYELIDSFSNKEDAERLKKIFDEKYGEFL